MTLLFSLFLFADLILILFVLIVKREPKDSIGLARAAPVFLNAVMRDDLAHHLWISTLAVQRLPVTVHTGMISLSRAPARNILDPQLAGNVSVR